MNLLKHCRMQDTPDGLGWLGDVSNAFLVSSARFIIDSSFLG